MLRRATALLLLAALTGLAGLAGLGLTGLTATARAGVWTYDTCTQPDGQPASTVGWSVSAQGGGPGGASGDENSCAAGAAGGGALTAGQNGNVPDDGGPVWLFTAPPGETIAGGTVVATLQAPQGEDWISTPGDTNTPADDFAYCAFNSPSPCSGTHTYSIDHAGGTNIYAVARCVDAGNCPSFQGEAARVSISSAQIELSDAALPTGTGFSGPLLSRRAHGVADLLFTASDPNVPPAGGDGPGVDTVTVTIDGTPVYSQTPNANGGACVAIPGGPAGGGSMFDSEQPCPTETSVDVPVDTRAFSDGGHDLAVSVTDAAGNTATVLDREITVSNPTTTPRVHRRGEVKTRLVVGWRWKGVHTRPHSIRSRGLLRRGEIALLCRGAHCPRLRLRRAADRHAIRLWHELEHATFHAGDRLSIVFRAAHHRPEPLQVRFRDGAQPIARLLARPPRALRG